MYSIVVHLLNTPDGHFECTDPAQWVYFCLPPKLHFFQPLDRFNLGVYKHSYRLKITCWLFMDPSKQTNRAKHCRSFRNAYKETWCNMEHQVFKTTSGHNWPIKPPVVPSSKAVGCDNIKATECAALWGRGWFFSWWNIFFSIPFDV